MKTVRQLTRRVNYAQYGEHHPINDHQWQMFQKAINNNLSIPEDYKSFMFKYNGGIFYESVFMPGPDGPVVAATFFPLFSPDGNSVDHHFKYFNKEIGFDMLPFADDPGGNYFFIDCKKDHFGKVYFWDHENGKMTEIADTFENFLNSLVLDE